ncbi:MAG: hypothetical protein H0U59_01810 [Gemmatimonadaceae bacterium]|nr:hypothetical protein [Gemmatimonadaceae bacterium]
MASYKLLVTRSAAKELEAVSAKDRGRIVTSIGRLEDDPHPSGVEKLSGDEK